MEPPNTRLRTCTTLVIILSSITASFTATVAPPALVPSVNDIFNLNTQSLLRIPRESKYLSRYSPSTTQDDTSLRSLKPEENPEARQQDKNAPVGKRCIRCDEYDRSSSYPSSYRTRYDDRYDTRAGYKDRYYDYDDRDRYDRYDRYYDRYDRYDRRPSDYDRSYDRYYDRSYDRYDRYDRDRYDPYDRRDAYDTRDTRDRGYNYRGTGYDNTGYDYRSYDRARPSYDTTSRGTTGYDTTGRGYHYNRPDYGTGYASSWSYGNKDGYRDRDRDYYDRWNRYDNRNGYDGYRATSYLFQSSSTARPVTSTVTENTQTTST